MQISIVKDAKLGGIVEINSESTDLKIATQKLPEASISGLEGLWLLTNNLDYTESGKHAAGYVITTPGEYEVDSCYIVSGFNQPESAEGIEISSIELERIRVFYLTGTAELDKELLSQLGVCDVLIVNVNTDFANQVKSVSAIDPQVILPVGDLAAIKAFEHELGITFEPTKKYKCRDLDFENEEYILRGYTLEA